LVAGHATVTVLAGPVATITVTPNPDTLVINGAQLFTAVGKDAGGNVVPITPALSWSVVGSGGTINGSSGLFTADTTLGTFTNTVEATSGLIVGHATVTVIAGPLATITVSPDPATVPTSLTQAFTAVGTDAAGHVVPIVPALSWSVVAGGGSIDAGTGLFTAGTTLGTFTNTVRAISGSISGFATVTVTLNLGSAATFAALGGAGASSCTGASTIGGDVGVDAGGTISGFPTPCVISAPGVGPPHVGDATAIAAQADVTTAYTSLAGMACTQDLTGQDLGTKTLTPGVYCFSTSAQLTGTLTLSGSATDVWVFQIGSTLGAAAGSIVTLSGANAGNVYWQVGSSATINGGSAWQGNILAQASVTLVSGTTLTGRALARTGAVTLDTDTITLPVP
jgi:hypothetical protein